MKHKVHLTREKATLFITLYAKALDYQSKKPILNDKKANEIFKMVDYDFGKLGNDDNDKIIVIRAREFDDRIEEFLGLHKNAVVLYLGCGLDSRVTRIRKSPLISWFDVDYPEVVALRKKFYSNSKNYKMIESSITKPEWLQKIPADRPTIIIAEGVFGYLKGKNVKVLINSLTKHFEHGELMFDVMNSFVLKMGKRDLKKQTGATHMWAVDDLRDVDRMDRKLKRISEISIFESKYVGKLPIKARLNVKATATKEPYRSSLRLLVYKF